jgi:hypothetical protein
VSFKGGYTYIEMMRAAVSGGDRNYIEDEMPALLDRLERMEVLMDDIDAKYSLLDDNSCDENRGKVRLFLAFDDVRKAWKGE